MKKHVVMIIIIIAICASIVVYALLSKEKEYEFDWDRFHDDIATIKQQYYASSDVIKDTINLLWENEDVCSIVSFSDSVDKAASPTVFYNNGRSTRLEEALPELYCSFMQCPEFIRKFGLSKSEDQEKETICCIGVLHYSSSAEGTDIIIYFGKNIEVGEVEEKAISFIMYTEQLDEDCWIVAETFGLV